MQGAVPFATSTLILRLLRESYATWSLPHQKTFRPSAACAGAVPYLTSTDHSLLPHLFELFLLFFQAPVSWRMQDGPGPLL